MIENIVIDTSVKDKETYKGCACLVRPGEIEPSFIDIAWSEDDDSKDNLLKEIIKIVTGKEKGKITNLGYLPTPIDNMTAFVDFDQFDPDSKFNLSLFGNPFFGNIIFLEVDINTENGAIIPIQNEKNKENIKNFIMNFKKFEKESGIYDCITNTDKTKFLEEFVKEKNSVLQEATKDIEGEHSEELKKAKEELKQLKEEGLIPDKEE